MKKPDSSIRKSRTPSIFEKARTVAAGLFLTGLATTQAAVLPYSNDFSGTGSNTAFPTENTNAEWTVSSGSYVFNFTSSTVTPSTASIPITNAANTPFTIETSFTVTATGTVNSNGATLGFGLFGSSSTFSQTGQSFYLADWQVANSGTSGLLRILSLGDAGGFTSSSTTVDDNSLSTGLAINVGTTYRLRLTGSYTGSTLNMSLGVWNAAGTTQIGSSATASDTSPLTGTNFGYRNRIGIGSGPFTANFDNFSIVPEPSAAVLVLVGGVLGLIRRRRKS